MEERIWLSSPTMHGDELNYINLAFETNWVSTIGENIDEIENQIGNYLGSQYSVALSSGTAALHLAYKLAGIKQGDYVLCSDMTFAATANPIFYEKAIPVFIDTEYSSWNMSPEALERAFELYPTAKVVCVANLYGNPADFDKICAICQKHNAVLIEDAAESFGSTYKGRKSGTFGKYNVISFNGNKIITGSSGGMLLTDEKEAADQVRKWATQARENAPWYQHEQIGYNYRMSNIIAGIVRGQIPYLQTHIAQKKAIYERYKEGFKDLPVEMNPIDFSSVESNYWLSCIIINEDAMCKQVRTNNEASFIKEKGKSCPTEILQLLSENNAEGRPIWKPLHLQPVCAPAHFVPAAEGQDIGADIFERGLCLPSDNKMTTEQQDKIINLVRSCFK